MSALNAPRHDDYDGGHRHDHGHRHHAHALQTPHPPSRLSPSILRLSLSGRLAIAAIATAALWFVVWLALR